MGRINAKNAHAVALGRLGGAAGSDAQREARARRKAGAGRPKRRCAVCQDRPRQCRACVRRGATA